MDGKEERDRARGMLMFREGRDELGAAGSKRKGDQGVLEEQREQGGEQSQVDFPRLRKPVWV